GLGHAVVAVGDGPQPEEELAMEWVVEEEHAAPRGVGNAFGVEDGEEQRELVGGDGQHGDVAVSNRARPPVERVDDGDAASFHQPAEIAGQRFALQPSVLVHGVLGTVAELYRPEMDGGSLGAVTAGGEALLEDLAC